MQFLLIGTIGFALLWFVALRPKPPEGGGPAAPTPAPAGQAAPKSSIPGGLGRSVDKARAAKTQGDAAAATHEAQANATAPATASKPAATPAAQKATPVAAKPKPARAVKPVPARPEPAGASPAKVRRALARGHAVVLLFYSSAGSDDRAVRSELRGVSRRGGRVNVWDVPVRGLSRFKAVLAGTQILQTPSVLFLSPRGRPPVVLNGYTDRAEIDQVAAAMLRKP